MIDLFFDLVLCVLCHMVRSPCFVRPHLQRCVIVYAKIELVAKTGTEYA